VVDESTNSLYGHVAYGHSDDEVAYVIPADDIFRQIKDSYGDTLKLKSLEPLSRKERPRERRARGYSDHYEKRPSRIEVETDYDSDNKRGRARARRRASRIFDRIKPSRKQRRRRQALHTIFKSAGTCFFLTVLLSVVLCLHFSLALFAQYVTDGKLDEMRDFLMDMVLQCFQLLIRETLATEDSESLKQYYREQVHRLKDIRPSTNRKSRFRSALDSLTEPSQDPAHPKSADYYYGRGRDLATAGLAAAAGALAAGEISTTKERKEDEEARRGMPIFTPT
jgi:hypothetical protein